jgi:hypothetical protein
VKTDTVSCLVYYLYVVVQGALYDRGKDLSVKYIKVCQLIQSYSANYCSAHVDCLLTMSFVQSTGPKMSSSTYRDALSHLSLLFRKLPLHTDSRYTLNTVHDVP